MNSADQFEAIVSKYYDPLFRFALSLTRTESDAQDLTQNTFLVWARKGHELRDRSKIKCWLFTTLHRAFLQARRKEARFPHRDLDEVTEQLPILTPEFADHVDSAQVLAMLAGIDEIFRAAVALFYLEDYSYKEIASILEIPIGTVRSRIARGVAQLRKALSHDLPASASATNAKPDTASEERADAMVHQAAPKRFDVSVSRRCSQEWDSSSTLLVATV
jgi:RNA polymerase sigma-70 factor (ECF subfamily)